MTDRWLGAWGLGSVAFGGASLLVPLYIVELGASPVQLGVLAATVAFGAAGLAPPGLRGEVLGAYVALGALGGALGGVLGGLTATLGYAVAFGVAGGLVIIGAALVVSLEALSGGGRAVTAPPEPEGGVETVGEEIPTRAANRDE